MFVAEDEILVDGCEIIFAWHPLKQLIFAISEGNNNNILSYFLILILKCFNSTNCREQGLAMKETHLVLEVMTILGVIFV